MFVAACKKCDELTTAKTNKSKHMKTQATQKITNKCNTRKQKLQLHHATPEMYRGTLLRCHEVSPRGYKGNTSEEILGWGGAGTCGERKSRCARRRCPECWEKGISPAIAKLRSAFFSSLMCLLWSHLHIILGSAWAASDADRSTGKSWPSSENILLWAHQQH